MNWGECINNGYQPVCPVCGAVGIYTIYRDKDGDIIGCEECVKSESADDADECIPL